MKGRELKDGSMHYRMKDVNSIPITITEWVGEGDGDDNTILLEVTPHDGEFFAELNRKKARKLAKLLSHFVEFGTLPSVPEKEPKQAPVPKKRFSPPVPVFGSAVEIQRSHTQGAL